MTSRDAPDLSPRARARRISLEIARTSYPALATVKRIPTARFSRAGRRHPLRCRPRPRRRRRRRRAVRAKVTGVAEALCGAAPAAMRTAGRLQLERGDGGRQLRRRDRRAATLRERKRRWRGAASQSLVAGERAPTTGARGTPARRAGGTRGEAAASRPAARKSTRICCSRVRAPAPDVHRQHDRAGARCDLTAARVAAGAALPLRWRWRWRPGGSHGGCLPAARHPPR